MTENLYIAIMTGVLTIMTIFLGWIAASISAISKELKEKVNKDDCRNDMGSHCHRLDALETRVNRNEVDIARISTVRTQA